jgi:hypothetical protein
MSYGAFPGRRSADAMAIGPGLPESRRAEHTPVTRRCAYPRSCPDLTAQCRCWRCAERRHSARTRP